MSLPGPVIIGMKVGLASTLVINNFKTNIPTVTAIHKSLDVQTKIVLHSTQLHTHRNYPLSVAKMSVNLISLPYVESEVYTAVSTGTKSQHL